MTTSPDRDNNAKPDLAGYLRAEAPSATAHARADDTGAPGTDDSMRDIEKSLVERIADVDDDRRRTATQLHKALNSHRDETAARLKRASGGLLALIAAVTLLLAGAVGWDLWHQTRERARQAEAMTAMSQRLDLLSTSVDTLGDRVAAAGQKASESAPAGQTVAGDVLRPVLDEQQRLAGELATLTATVKGLPEKTREIAERTAREAAAATAEETARGIAGGRVRAPEPSGDASAPTGAEPVVTLSAAELDRLIDRQLASLERNYQRLATQVSSPAVRPTAPPPEPAGSDASSDASAPPSPQGPAGDAETGAPEITAGDRHYALQLIGFYSRDELDAFIAANPLPAQVYTRQETFRGQPWFVLIHSLHPDLTSAAETRRALPPPLADLDVWVRDLPADTRLQVIDTSGD